MELKLRNGSVIRVARVDPGHARLRGKSSLVLSGWIRECWERGQRIATPQEWPAAYRPFPKRKGGFER